MRSCSAKNGIDVSRTLGSTISWFLRWRLTTSTATSWSTAWYIVSSPPRRRTLVSGPRLHRPMQPVGMTFASRARSLRSIASSKAWMVIAEPADRHAVELQTLTRNG
jgi:hypothetical protein